METLAGIFLILIFLIVVVVPALFGAGVRKRNPPMPFWGALYRWMIQKLPR
jgi:hypothetical protein